MTKLAALILVAGWWVQAAVAPQEYKARRQALRRALADGVFVLAGAGESERGDLRTSFFQESNFLYLTGWRCC
jgi:hypothetical protein